MNEQKSYYTSGVSIVVGVALFIGSVLYFSGNRSFFTKYNFYYVTFPSTQGLNIGSVISLAGIEVGHVANIDLDAKDEARTQIQINQKFANRLTEHTVASIKTQGALGDKYIFLENALPGGNALAPNSEIPSNRKPDLLDMISGKSNDLNVLKDTLAELGQLLKNLNSKGQSALLIERMVQTSESMTKLLSDPSIKSSFLHLRSILEKIDQGQGTLGQLVNDPTIHQRLVQWVGESPRNSYLKPLLREAIKQNEQQKR